MKPNDRSRRILHIALLTSGILAAVSLFYLLAQAGIGIPCLFHRLTGLQCPGCGNSRAAIALLQLDLPASFRYNPLFLPEAFYIAWVYFHCCRSYLKGHRFSYTPPFPLLDIMLLIAVIAWGLLRNIK